MADTDATADQGAEERVMEAVWWALGLGDDFPSRQDGEGMFWWRKELAERAGISPEQIQAKAAQEKPSAD